MKKRIFSVISVVMLIVMTLPAASPPVVAAGGAAVDFTQFANKETYNKWIGSILQKNNSIYYESIKRSAPKKR